MEINLKKRLTLNRTLPVKGNTKDHKRMAGITSGNVAGASTMPSTYERSGEYLAHMAEVEIRRSLALAETYRSSIR
jgi:hypothetical protein